MVEQLPAWLAVIERADAPRPAEHVPDRSTRKFVRRMIVAGVTRLVIAELLNIDDAILAAHYKVELQAHHIANQRVAQVVFRKALAGDITAAIFWLKARANFRDRDQTLIMDDGRRPAPTIESKQLEAALTSAINNLRPVATVPKQQQISDD
jgi:hypothetical protein